MAGSPGGTGTRRTPVMMPVVGAATCRSRARSVSASALSVPGWLRVSPMVSPSTSDIAHLAVRECEHPRRLCRPDVVVVDDELFVEVPRHLPQQRPKQQFGDGVGVGPAMRWVAG